MCRDILKSVLRTLTETEQVAISRDHIRALSVKFRREAQNLTRQYFVDARFNGIEYDRHHEEATLESFEKLILQAGEDYLNDATGTQIPDWTRALAVMPHLREQLRDATVADMGDAREQNAQAQALDNIPSLTVVPQ